MRLEIAIAAVVLALNVGFLAGVIWAASFHERNDGDKG